MWYQFHKALQTKVTTNCRDAPLMVMQACSTLITFGRITHDMRLFRGLVGTSIVTALSAIQHIHFPSWAYGNFPTLAFSLLYIAQLVHMKKYQYQKPSEKDKAVSDLIRTYKMIRMHKWKWSNILLSQPQYCYQWTFFYLTNIWRRNIVN